MLWHSKNLGNPDGRGGGSKSVAIRGGRGFFSGITQCSIINKLLLAPLIYITVYIRYLIELDSML